MQRWTAPRDGVRQGQKRSRFFGFVDDFHDGIDLAVEPFAQRFVLLFYRVGKIVEIASKGMIAKACQKVVQERALTRRRIEQALQEMPMNVLDGRTVFFHLRHDNKERLV